MTTQERGPASGRMAPVEPTRREPDSQRATPRQALWSWAVAAAVVFVLGIVFYQINAADNSHVVAKRAPVTPSIQTTGQGGSPNAPQPTGSDR
jgi:hypothetical protein